MAKENHDPIALNSAEIPSTKLPKTHQNSSANNVTTTTTNASDLFDLLARCQSQRLDDQRCALPSYFSQVSWQNPFVAGFSEGWRNSKSDKRIDQLKDFNKIFLRYFYCDFLKILRPTQHEFELILSIPLFDGWQKKRNEKIYTTFKKNTLSITHNLTYTRA